MNILWGIVLVVLPCSYSAGIPVHFPEESEGTDYFWRKYNGTIPNDALIGGKYENGSITYIGQTVHEQSIVPGEIHPSFGKMVYAWYGPKHVTDNIKILCVKFPERFQWIKANNYKFYWDKHIIQGGYLHLQDRPYLIGKANHKNKMQVVGEVIATDKEISIYYSADGIENHIVNNFDLLSYNYVPKALDLMPKPSPKPSETENGCLNKVYNFIFN